VKWTYKDCEVEITAVNGLPTGNRFTPIVEIHCNNTINPEHRLRTRKTFETEIQTQLHGQRLAKLWIDKCVRMN